MNLGSILKGVFGLLFGGESLGYYNSDGSYYESDQDYTNLSGALDNLGKKISGSGLTNADRQANAFTAEREDIAWQRQMQASNTAYQRQVADMQAAGINPMMAVSGGSGAVVLSASASGSVSPSGASLNLGSILSAIVNMKLAKSEMKLKDAQAAKATAEASRAESETKKTDVETDFFKNIAGVRAESERLSNELTRSQMRQIEQYINESKSKQQSNIANALLARANADNLAALQPYVMAELGAKTELERMQARVAVVDAAYREHLLDSGVIEQSIRESGSNIKANEAIAELHRISGLIAKGDKHALSSELGTLDKIDFWAKDVVSTLTDIVKSIPVNFVVK